MNVVMLVSYELSQKYYVIAIVKNGHNRVIERVELW